MNKTKLVFLSILILSIGFILGVYGMTDKAQEVVKGVVYDASYLVGDVYNGMSNVLMMQNGEFVGPIDTDDAATFGSTVSVTGAVTLSSTVTYLEKTTSLSANSSTTNAMSGTTFYIDTTGSTTTLPAVATATGTVYRWVVGSAFATHDFTINSAEGDNIEGSMIVAGAVVDCDASDKIKFVVDGENLGDFVQLRSNGQKWYITESNALTAAKLTCDG